MCGKNQAVTILRETVEACRPLLGEALQEAYLYGSYARGDYDGESDVDILLTAAGSRESLAQYRREIAAVSSTLSLKHDVTVSITLKPQEQFWQYGEALPFYRNVRREGIRYAV